VFGILREEMAAQRRRDGIERIALWPDEAPGALARGLDSPASLLP
jgi:hypothetical protein